ncbi:uncharacterized protein LOC112564664 isoform X2 [Pomacea canaliculata]|uniref:uncharacterized protein LOC112564664 isoform X2 n=1 Tax=Pomacea canaliculata TaxID=400727 RepID=UPI000D730B35|nr:uncharacterized protein LOC112564664 isoform X2 [Pomacea canaliculata]
MSSLWLLLALLLPTVVTPFPQDFLEKQLQMMLREQFPADYLENHLEMNNREQLPSDTLEEYPDRENRQLLASADDGYNNLLAVLRQLKNTTCPPTGLSGPNKYCSRRNG